MSTRTITDPPALVGRKQERARLGSLATAPGEQSLTVLGSRGMGKTRLLAQAAAESLIQSTLVHANPSEADLPFAGFSAVFAWAPNGRLSGLIDRRGATPTDSRGIFSVAKDALIVLRDLHLEPHLVLIDDIDRMDPESRLLLGFMASRLAGTNLKLVVSMTAHPDAHTFSAGDLLELARLSDIESHELVTTIVNGPVAPGILRVLSDRSGGIPARLIANARELTEGQLTGGDPLVLPLRGAARRGRTSAGERAQNGPVPQSQDPAQRVLGLLALAPYARLEAITAVGDAPPDIVDVLVESGYVTANGHRITLNDHDLRSRLFWAMDPAERRGRHAELAEAYAAIDPALELWHTSFVHPEREQLAEALLRHAATLVRHGERSSPVDIAERAVGLAPDPAAIVVQVLDLAEAFILRGELDLASRYLDLVEQDAVESQGIRLASLDLVIAYVRTWLVPDAEVETTADAHATDEAEASAALLDLASMSHTDRWEFQQSAALLERAERVLAKVRADAPAVHTHAKTLLRAFDGRLPSNTEPMTPPSDARPEILLSHALSLSSSERYDRARRGFALVAARSKQREPIWYEAAVYLSARNEIAAGNLHLARMLTDELARVPLPQLTPRSSRLLLRAWHAAIVDDRDRFAALSLECVERASTEDNLATAGSLYALQGSLALLEHDDEGALRLLELADRADAPNPALLRHAADLVEAQVTLGLVDEARAVRDDLRARVRTRPSRWSTLALARIDANLAPAHERSAAFESCLARFQSSDSSYELGKAAANATRRLAELEDKDASRRASATARAAFERSGALAFARRMIASEPRTERVQPPSVTTLLTDEERRIVDLVRRGLRNREIAAAMYLSLRSVEAKLTTIYRKVNARTRSHLVAMMSESTHS